MQWWTKQTEQSLWLQLTIRPNGEGRMETDPERNYFCAVKAGQAGRDQGNSVLAHGPATEDGHSFLLWG